MPQETMCSRSPKAAIEDFTETVDRHGVVRVRSDCPVQTAHSIFEHRPSVQALVAADGRPLVVRTLTRDFFITHILPSCICPLPGFSRPGPLPKLASMATSGPPGKAKEAKPGSCLGDEAAASRHLVGEAIP